MLRKAPEQSDTPAYVIGYNLSDFMKEGFLVISALLGSLGSFFSGSTTVSNLTFGVVQQTAARGIDVSVTAMLALQVRKLMLLLLSPRLAHLVLRAPRHNSVMLL